LIKISECKGVFQSFLIKLHIDNGITFVQLNLCEERFSWVLKHLIKMIENLLNRTTASMAEAASTQKRPLLPN
jgi:hypothetical protein